MVDILQWLGSAAGVLALCLFVIFKKGAQKYVDEKAKNLATIEDTAKITQEVEGVKALHLRQSHAWKWIFEKEYDILQRVMGFHVGLPGHCAFLASNYGSTAAR